MIIEILTNTNGKSFCSKSLLGDGTWQRNRLPEISERLLSEIKDKILSESDAEEFKNLMEVCAKNDEQFFGNFAYR